MFIGDIMPNFKEMSESFQQYTVKRYDSFVKNTCLPERYSEYVLTEDCYMPPKLKIVYDEFFDIVSNRESYLFLINKNDLEFFTKFIKVVFDNYFCANVFKESHLEDIMYLNTELLSQDYKNIDNGRYDEAIGTTYDRKSILFDIYNYPMIVWNYFDIYSDKYTFKRILNIVKARYEKRLGNIFIAVKGTLDRYSTEIQFDYYESMVDFTMINTDNIVKDGEND